ncbi:PREDICTED: stress response protein nst1-like [Populus euphratica]|uniref:Stress response protein nst1-like n=1 Tax=Populus euphratica TaxID=75702 RepID=A0AAJ6Y7Y0_POPEU|nr:PREDICTED: stress response protein nst1-like [Populus euphratica]
MRHQYLLVKQKIKKPEFSSMDNLGCGGGECSGNEDEFDWLEGHTHWSNFLLYKEVFGDLPVSYGTNGSNYNDLMGVLNEDRENGGGLLGGVRGMEMVEFGQLGSSADGDFARIDGGENGVLGLGFDYEGEEAEENCNGNDRVREDGDDGFMYEEVEPNMSNLRRKRKALKGFQKRVFGFLSNQLVQLRDMKARLQQRELERKQERQGRENVLVEREQEWEQKLEEREKKREKMEKDREKLTRQRIQEWEAMEKESKERERRRREEELIQEREWKDRMNRKRSEWKKRIDEMLSQHRVEMGQFQTRIHHEQQNLIGQLLGIVSQWIAPTGLSDHTGTSNHYLSQMMQNLHHVNGMVHGDSRVDGDTQDDQFIVDG